MLRIYVLRLVAEHLEKGEVRGRIEGLDDGRSGVLRRPGDLERFLREEPPDSEAQADGH